MEPWLVVLIVVVVVAVALYVWQQNARSGARKRDDAARWRQAATEAERAPSQPVRSGGLLQSAADTATGKEYETATGQLNEMTARLEAAREEADRAASRLAGRADAALAAVQAAAAAHGGAVPGDGTHNCPRDYPIKGTMPTRQYHLPGEPSYSRTIPGVCFQNAAAAEAAGFSRAGDAAAVQADATVARESAALSHRDTVAVADEASGIEIAEEMSGADVAAAASADVGGVPPGAIRGDGGRDCPPAYPIKAHETSRVYREPGTTAYSTLVPQLCFSSVESARTAGFTPARDG